MRRTPGALAEHGYYQGAFSGVDANVLIKFPNGTIVQWGTLATITISAHRDKFPVMTLGRVKPIGFTYGPRTVAGNIVFNTIDRNAFAYAGYKQQVRTNSNSLDSITGPPAADQLPLFDVHIHHVNEQGMQSFEVLLGVTILDISRTISVDNVNPTEIYSYMALDYVPMSSTRETAPGFVLDKPVENKRSITVVDSRRIAESWNGLI